MWGSVDEDTGPSWTRAVLERIVSFACFTTT
jgi:hypothetical protein